MNTSKVLTLEQIIHIIAVTPAPVQGETADDVILSRIQRYIDSGHTLTPEADAEVAKHRDNAKPQVLQEAAE
jgi:hypothetical protein